MTRKLFFFLFLLLSTLSLSNCTDSDKEKMASPQKVPLIPVEYILAEKKNVPVWLEYTGKTEATKRIKVRARVSGRLEEALFEEGDIVKKDQQLFTIEKTSYQAEVEKANAILQKDQASLALAIADVKRYEPLVADGLAPRATLEQYVARRGELEATIKGDRAAIRDAELNLSYTDVVAPVSGRISRKFVDVGNIVSYGESTVLTTIVVDNPIFAYFNPTEEELQAMRKFKDQDTMDARVRVPDTMVNLIKRPHFTGHVDFTDNRVDPQTGTITMRAIIENPLHMLLEGTFVYTEIFLTNKKPFFTIPPDVVFDDQRGSFVYVIDENNTVQRADVKRGYSNRHFLTIPEGLEDGSKVIINGLAKIKDGTKVQPTDVTDTKGVHAQMKDKGLIP